MNGDVCREDALNFERNKRKMPITAAAPIKKKGHLAGALSYM
jgi:hypothetical protein